MSLAAFDWRPAGVDALTLVFGDRVDPHLSRNVLTLYHHLRTLNVPGIVELIPSYATLHIQFDPTHHAHEPLVHQLRTLAASLHHIPDEAEGALKTIPTWYAPQSGPDLERIARLHRMSVEEVIAIHSGTEYRVYALGFVPGFAYMGTIDPRIATPRLPTPRTRIPAGSVALANTQAAVYPSVSPGGWNLLGRTWLTMFEPDREGFSYLMPGDRVRFVPISLEEYRDHGGEV